MMYLGIEGTLPELGHHTIYLAEDYRRNLAEIEAGLAPAEPSFYVQERLRHRPGAGTAGPLGAVRAGPGGPPRQ